MQVSFVNSICTLKGGTHVKLIVDQICKCAPTRVLLAAVLLLDGPAQIVRGNCRVLLQRTQVPWRV